MYNLYTNSTVSLRSRAYLSLPFNDHPSYSHSYSARYPSLSPCCCYNCNCCSSIPVNSVTSCRLVPINPSLTFGFRQSTLIQWPPSGRKIILSGRDRREYGAPVDDPGRIRISYGGICCIRDTGADRIRKVGSISKVKGIGLWGYKRRVFEERLIFRKVGSACEDAEAIISLLTEEVGQEFLNVREAAGSFHKGVVKENVVMGKSKLRKGNGLESVEVQHRKKSYRTRCGKENFGKGECSRLRKQGSSGSSYYSCSDSSDYESDSEVVVAAHQEYVSSEKESRESFGGVGIGERVKDELVRYKNQQDRNLESGKKDDIEVGTSVKGDRRKNLMKFTEDSLDENASRKGFGLNQSRRYEGSRMKKLYSYRGKESNSEMNSSGALRSGYHRTDNQVSGTSDSSYKYKHRRESSSRADENSSKKVNEREENVASSCVFCTTCGQVSSGNETRSNSEQRSKILQIQENNFNLVSNMDTLKRVKERSSLLQKSADEVNEQHLYSASGQINPQNFNERADAAESYEENTNFLRQHPKLSEAKHKDMRLASAATQQSDSWIKRQKETSALLQTSLEDVNEKTRQTDSTRKSQNHSSITDAGVSFVQNTSTTQQQEEARMKYSEENLASFISSQPAEGGQYQTVTEIGTQNQSTNASEAHTHETMAGKSQNASQKKLHYERSYLNERVKSVEQRIETHEQVSERVKQTDIRFELQRPCREASFREKETRNPYVTSTSQIRSEEIGDIEVKKNMMAGLSPRLAPPPQSIERDPVYAESASRFTRQDSGQSSGGGSSIYIYPEATDASSSRQASVTFQDPSHVISHVDLLGSAERLDKSSLQVIGDFLDNARHEASTSGTCMDKKLSKRQCVSEGVIDTNKHSSDSGATKGPTEEMWGLQEPPQEEASKTAAAPVNVVVGRSGRTLWNVLADVARFRWGPRAAESHRSPVKSSGQSSSSNSPSSEAWFSGHDPDEVQGGNMRSAASSTIPEPSPSDRPLLIRTPTQSPTVDNAPSSSSSGVSRETNLELNVDDQTLQATTSVDWSQPAAGLFRRSHRRSYATIELLEGGKEAVGSGIGDHIKDNLDSTLSEVSGSGDNAAEVERRKLLRNKQVVRERFEEWEEAYMMESEQRKMDEIFMREALEEAKKAADMWEVPVGAVLVQDGKIIARGYNLVEDLRDSTAHAEMICIREASNVLKAWRLSDTTLYVTLEPCAMCAGAILQARIGTLVYGAPNKLLGADGSWIRLFPCSTDREGSSESTAKPEGPPVHPFHPNMTIRRGILETECADAMQQFFRLRRRKDKITLTQQHPGEQPRKKLLLHPSKLLRKMHHVFHFLFCL